MRTQSRLWICAAALAGVAATAGQAGAQETPFGACVMKTVRQEQADRKACNDRHGTTVTPERTACFRKVDTDRRAANAECDKLPKDHPKKK